MHRRLVLTMLPAMLPAAGVAAATPASPGQSDWDAWTEAFVTPEGRAVDALQGMASHSEGQGWAMLLAAHHRDEARFARLFAWTEDHLAVRQDPLLSWRWRPDEGIVDYNNASDGDLFYAWALLIAARRFGQHAYAVRAGAVAQAIDAILVKDAPGGGLLLRPAAEDFAAPGSETVNPSYTMPLALHALGAAFDLPRLARVATDSEALIARIASAGPVPDWVRLDAEGWQPSSAHGPQFSYDALRVALYLAWSGRLAHPAVTRARSIYEDAAGATPARVDPTATPVRVDPTTGAVLDRSDAPGYAAVAALIRRAGSAAPDEPLPPFTAAQPYYPATLHLLTHLAAGALSPG